MFGAWDCGGLRGPLHVDYNFDADFNFGDYGGLGDPHVEVNFGAKVNVGLRDSLYVDSY